MVLFGSHVVITNAKSPLPHPPTAVLASAETEKKRVLCYLF